MVEEFSSERQLVAGLRARVSAAELGAFFGRAMQAAAAAGELIGGPATAVYHEDAGDAFDVTIGFPVSAEPDPALGLDLAALPAGPALRITHTGPYGTLGEAYRALEAELGRRGLQRTLSWESYLVGPADEPDPAAWTTEVVVPLGG